MIRFECDYAEGCHPNTLTVGPLGWSMATLRSPHWERVFL